MKSTTFAWLAGLGLSAAAFADYTYKRFDRKAEDKWVHVGFLESIVLYPVRSAAALHLNQVECFSDSLKYQGVHDRQFVLILENEKSAWAGVYPKMLGISTEIMNEDLVVFSFPKMKRLELNLQVLKESQRPPLIKEKKGFSFHLLEGEEEHHRWFSQAILGKDHGLKFYMKQEPLIRRHWFSLRKPEHYPVMLMTDKSLDDLNNRLSIEDRASAEQFRPNFVVSTSTTCQPYEEDLWDLVKIGKDSNSSVILEYNSFCYRCILPNIDVDTCERNKNFEPLRTLKSYRLKDNPMEPVMGCYFDVLQTGCVQRGDSVYVQYKNSSNAVEF